MKRIAIAALVAAACQAGAARAQVEQNDKAVSVQALSADLKQKECVGLYSGNVVATRGAARLTSDKLTLIGSRDAAAGAKAECETERMIAEGQVGYSGPAIRVRADKGEYDTVHDIITFTGDVFMTSADQGVMHGTQLVYNVTEKSARLSAGGKPVMMIITPKSGG